MYKEPKETSKPVPPAPKLPTCTMYNSKVRPAAVKAKPGAGYMAAGEGVTSKNFAM